MQDMRASVVILILLLAGPRLPASDPPGREEGVGYSPLRRSGRAQPSAEVSLLHASSSVNLQTGEAQRTFIVQVDLIVPELVDAVGLSHQIELTELRDGDGEDLLAAWRRTGQLVFGGPRHYGAIRPHRNPGSRGAVSLSTSLNGLPYIPPTFSVVRGKAYVLLASRRVVRELRPVTQSAILELTPSLSIQIVRLKREAGSLEVQFEYDAGQPAPFFNPNVEPPFIEAVRLLDDQGQEVAGHGGTPQEQPPRERLFRGNGQLVFGLPEGRQPAALRFDVVLEMEEREVEFIARNVAMPVEE